MDMMSMVRQGAKALKMDEKQLLPLAQKALPYLSKVRSKQDAFNALKEVGISNEFIDYAIGAMDSPKGKQLANMATFLGLNTDIAKNQLRELKTGNSVYATNPITSRNSDIDSLKRGLQRKK